MVKSSCIVACALLLSSVAAGGLRGDKNPADAARSRYLVHDASAIHGSKIGERVYFGERGVDECVQACEHLFDCIGFVEVLDAERPYCVLKDDSATQHPATGKRVHLKPATDDAATLGAGSYESLASSAIQGNKIGERIVYDKKEGIKACVDACDALDNCVAIVASELAVPRYCVLKDSTRGLHRKAGKRVFKKPGAVEAAKPSEEEHADDDEVEKENLGGARLLGGDDEDHYSEYSNESDEGGIWTVQTWKAIRGNSIGGRLYYSVLDECQEACASSNACVGFVDNYLRSPKYCVLKKSTSTLYTRSGKNVHLKP